MSYKDVIKKFGKIAIMGATLMGSIGVVSVANEIRGNSTLVSAAAINTYTLVDSNGKNVATSDGGTLTSITTKGNLYYAKFIASETNSGYKYTCQGVNTVISSDNYSALNFTGEYIMSDSLGSEFTIFSANSKFSEWCNAVSNLTSTSELYGPDFVDFLKQNGLTEMVSNIMLRADTVSKNYKLNLSRVNTDETAPVYEGWEGVYYTDFDNPKDLSKIIEKIKLKDETDGYINFSVETDEYTSNKKVLGNHKVVLTGSDAAGNTTKLTLYICVVDGTKPVISGINKYTSNMSSPITEATVRSGLTVSDNHDTNLTIELVEDNFTANNQKAGSYVIKYKVTDSSGNPSEIFVVTITNKDDIKPTITGITEFNVASTATVSVDHLKSLLQTSDNIDTNLTSELISDGGYFGNESKVGTYNFTFKTTDSSGNVSETHTIAVKVYDNIPPVFWVSSDFFSVDESLTLTHDQIVEALLLMNDIDTTQVVSYKFNSDNYTENANTAGTYAVSLSLKMIDGSIINLDSNINVVGEKQTEEDPTDNKKENKVSNSWTKIKDFFKKNWIYIVTAGGAFVLGLFVTLALRPKKRRRR